MASLLLMILAYDKVLARRRELLRGPLYYILVLIAVTLAYWRESPAGMVAVALMCGGDGIADIVGRRYGKGNPLPWNGNKSWAGSFAMFAGAGYLPQAFLWLQLGSLPKIPSSSANLLFIGTETMTSRLQRLTNSHAACCRRLWAGHVLRARLPLARLLRCGRAQHSICSGANILGCNCRGVPAHQYARGRQPVCSRRRCTSQLLHAASCDCTVSVVMYQMSKR